MRLVVEVDRRQDVDAHVVGVWSVATSSAYGTGSCTVTRFGRRRELLQLLEVGGSFGGEVEVERHVVRRRPRTASAITCSWRLRRHAPLCTSRIGEPTGPGTASWYGRGVRDELGVEAEVPLVLVDDAATHGRPRPRLRDVAADDPLEPRRDASEPHLVIVVQSRAVLVQVGEHAVLGLQLDRDGHRLDVVRDRDVEPTALQVLARPLHRRQPPVRLAIALQRDAACRRDRCSAGRRGSRCARRPPRARGRSRRSSRRSRG